jgi:tRNA threonylcarbamoyladenosine biosynthesis protein TsaB
MVVLALDTTTRIGSCALARDGAVICEAGSDPERSHAEHLPGDLQALLAAAQVSLDAVDVFAVAIGPGSFTGLRVGIATMQGLAFAMNRPLVGVSGLEALALIAGRAEPETAAATWVDAWRGEIYAALYERGSEVEVAAVEHPATVLARLRRHDRTVFIGDGAATFAAQIRELLGEQAVFADPMVPLLAGAIAQLAHAAAAAGHRPAADAIRPLYVRRTDAELARDARSGR